MLYFNENLKDYDQSFKNLTPNISSGKIIIIIINFFSKAFL